MRLRALVLVFLIAAVAAGDDAPKKPLTPTEAAKKLNEKVTIEMLVKSTGGNTACFLNSEEDFKDEKNFTVFLPDTTIEKLKKAKVEDPKTYYKGKTVHVTGTVSTFRDKPQIKVDEPEQIKVIEKEKDKK